MKIFITFVVLILAASMCVGFYTDHPDLIPGSSPFGVQVVSTVITALVLATFLYVWWQILKVMLEPKGDGAHPRQTAALMAFIPWSLMMIGIVFTFALGLALPRYAELSLEQTPAVYDLAIYILGGMDFLGFTVGIVRVINFVDVCHRYPKGYMEGFNGR